MQQGFVSADLQLNSRGRAVLEEGVVVIPTGQGVQGLSRGTHVFRGSIPQMVCMPDHLHAHSRLTKTLYACSRVETCLWGSILHLTCMLATPVQQAEQRVVARLPQHTCLNESVYPP